MHAMRFISKFAARLVANSIALYVASTYVHGFTLRGGIETILIGSLILAILNTFVRPILKIVTAPLIFLSFGLFIFVIYGVFLWTADQLLIQLDITSIYALAAASFIVALANALI